MSSKTKKYAYFIALGIIINMCLGAVYSWSIFRKPLENLLSLSSTLSGLPFMFFLVFYSCTMPFAGKLIEKYGPKKITIIGGAIVSLGWFLSSFAENIYMLILTYGVIGGSGVGVVYGAPLAVATKWFPQKKGLAVGLTLSGFGLSPFITAPASMFLIDNYGVLSAFKILGIFFLAIITLLALPLKFPDKNYNQLLEDKISKNTAFELDLSQVTKDIRFKILWVCFIIGTFSGLMAIGISSPIAQEVIGLTPEKSALYIAIFAIFNGLGRPLFGIMTDKLHFKKVSIISFFLIIIASATMLNADVGTVELYVISFSIFWFILGGWLSIAPTTISSVFGVKNYTRNYGVLFTAYGFGAISANILSGLFKDFFGSYLYVFYATMLTAIIGILIVVLLFKNNSNKIICNNNLNTFQGGKDEKRTNVV